MWDFQEFELHNWRFFIVFLWRGIMIYLGKRMTWSAYTHLNAFKNKETWSLGLFVGGEIILIFSSRCAMNQWSVIWCAWIQEFSSLVDSMTSLYLSMTTMLIQWHLFIFIFLQYPCPIILQPGFIFKLFSHIGEEGEKG